ncbi:MAG TPA: hypothetical protein VK808_10355 [Bacteroidia bacterium]|jgi:antitoxin component YwqK of YwqJK toxin-antitoxin module|nr:hypothetical protein [Bacteroidia bacterium]
MKKSLLIIISFGFALNAIGQQASYDEGFTNKAEAKNQLVNGVKDGKWVEYDTCYGNNPNNDTIGEICGYKLTVYRDDKPVGVIREYSIDGKIKSEIPMKSGKENGTENRYYDSGKLHLETPYVNDKRNGTVKEYYENGKLKTETIYTNNKAGETKNYDENGNEIK